MLHVRQPLLLCEHSKQAFAPAVGVKSAPSPPNVTQSPRSSPSSPTSPPSTNFKKALVHFISGGLSAGLVRICLQPLDTIKTRLQANVTHHPLRQTLLANQGIRGLYRGVIPGVVGIVPAAAVYMLCFQTLKSHFLPLMPNLKDPVIALSAALSDVAACLVRVPCEVTKQRLQVGVYQSVWQAFSAGPKTLYRGLGAQLARDVPYAATEFVVYERLRERWKGGEGFLVVGVAGGIAAVASNPMDVVKTRLMTGRGEGVFQTLWQVGREGVGMRGVLPRVVAKVVQSALFFGVYEKLREAVAKVVGVEVSQVEKWREEKKKER